MKIRIVAVLAAPLAACLTMSAQAAPPTKAPAPLAMTDLQNDANFVSTQGLVSSPAIPQGTATPADVDAADILGVTIAPTGTTVSKKVGKKTVKTFDCTGFTATLTLGGAPLTTGALYRVSTSSTLYDVYWLEYRLVPGMAAETVLRYTDPEDTTGLDTLEVAIASAKVEGSKIVFTVTNKNIKATGEKVNHTTLSGFGADVRVDTGVITAPMFDQLVTDGSQAWKVCPL